jgi:hypothetical protein
MREILTYGSVRGVPGNRHPYRDTMDNSQLPPPPLSACGEGGWGVRTGRRVRPRAAYEMTRQLTINN